MTARKSTFRVTVDGSVAATSRADAEAKAAELEAMGFEHVEIDETKPLKKGQRYVTSKDLAAAMGVDMAALDKAARSFAMPEPQYFAEILRRMKP